MHLLGPAEQERAFGLRDPVQYDDYPYVEFMRWVDQICKLLGLDPLFYEHPDASFRDPMEWGTLIELINDDLLGEYERPTAPADIARWLFRRIDAAQLRAGAQMKIGRLPDDVQEAFVERLVNNRLEEGMSEARKLLDPARPVPGRVLGVKTAVIEFARGGPHGAPLPLDPPYGYRFAFSHLCPQVLERASVLYIKVPPVESRRKNLERAPTGAPGEDSSLFHAVPMNVMLGDYGQCDFEYLVAQDGGSTMRIDAHGVTYHLPAAVFDNSDDITSFVRLVKDPADWSQADKARLRAALDAGMGRLAGR
ncbi:MAG: hypothetical protein ABIO70_24255 [Pseudomonadota bacterium]